MDSGRLVGRHYCASLTARDNQIPFRLCTRLTSGTWVVSIEARIPQSTVLAVPLITEAKTADPAALIPSNPTRLSALNGTSTSRPNRAVGFATRPSGTIVNSIELLTIEPFVRGLMKISSFGGYSRVTSKINGTPTCQAFVVSIFCLFVCIVQRQSVPAREARRPGTSRQPLSTWPLSSQCYH